MKNFFEHKNLEGTAVVEDCFLEGIDAISSMHLHNGIEFGFCEFHLSCFRWLGYFFSTLFPGANLKKLTARASNILRQSIKQGIQFADYYSQAESLTEEGWLTYSDKENVLSKELRESQFYFTTGVASYIKGLGGNDLFNYYFETKDIAITQLERDLYCCFDDSLDYIFNIQQTDGIEQPEKFFIDYFCVLIGWMLGFYDKLYETGISEDIAGSLEISEWEEDFVKLYKRIGWDDFFEPEKTIVMQ